MIGMLALLLLFYNIIRQAVTLIAVENTVDPATLADRPLEELSEEELAAILSEHVTANRMRVLILKDVVGADQKEWAALNQQSLENVLESGLYPEELADLPFKDLELEQIVSILQNGLSRDGLQRAVIDEVVQPVVTESWTLNEALLNRDEIDKIIDEKHPNAEVSWKVWVNLDFLTTPMHSRPELSGLRTAVFGSLWMMLVTVAFAFPIGIGAAIYLEEYAADNWLNRIIQLNISNLAGVPSIIYGILGLAVFVRFLDEITSGKIFGLVENEATVSGRTILSAGLTMALLILPIIIISAQEAIKAVSPSLKEAAYGMGATKLQMIRTVILPNALPGILTGTILAISRAFGETAPLVVVGSITRITVDPEGPFSRFTAIPIQIYSWTSQPQDEFRSIAAAAIIVLLIILLSFNATAIILRNRFSRRW
ncbi:MAG: phosphate ABC transporter permease PstA [Anaerolineae bacterium]|nr:MAG: phosphate ABC transporter permease PstA [Anaerolineae bacterium]